MYLKEVQKCFKWVSRQFPKRKFQEYFISTVFQENLNVSMKFCFAIFFSHGSHRSYPSRRRACFYVIAYQGIHDTLVITQSVWPIVGNILFSLYRKSISRCFEKNQTYKNSLVNFWIKSNQKNHWLVIFEEKLNWKIID